MQELGVSIQTKLAETETGRRQLEAWASETVQPALCIGGPRKQGKTLLLKEMTRLSREGFLDAPVAYVDLMGRDIFDLPSLLNGVAESLAPDGDLHLCVENRRPGMANDRVIAELVDLLDDWAERAILDSSTTPDFGFIILDHFDEAILGDGAATSDSSVAEAATPRRRTVGAAIIDQLLVAVNAHRAEGLHDLQWTLVLPHRFSSTPTMLNWFRSLRRKQDSEQVSRAAEIVRLSGLLERMSTFTSIDFLRRAEAIEVADALGVDEDLQPVIADYSGGWLYPLAMAADAIERWSLTTFGNRERDALRPRLRQFLDMEVVRFFMDSAQQRFDRVVDPDVEVADGRRERMISLAIAARSTASRRLSEESLYVARDHELVEVAAAWAIPPDFSTGDFVAPCVADVLVGRRYLAVDVENVVRQVEDYYGIEHPRSPAGRDQKVATRTWEAIVQMAWARGILMEDLYLFGPSDRRIHDVLSPSWDALSQETRSMVGPRFNPKLRSPLIPGEGADDHMMMMWAQSIQDTDPSASLVLLSDDKDGSSATTIANSPLHRITFANPTRSWAKKHVARVNDVYTTNRLPAPSWMDEALVGYL